MRTGLSYLRLNLAHHLRLLLVVLLHLLDRLRRVRWWFLYVHTSHCGHQPSGCEADDTSLLVEKDVIQTPAIDSAGMAGGSELHEAAFTGLRDTFLQGVVEGMVRMARMARIVTLVV